MPLQNRCDPFGTLHAARARGSMMGNRGGRVHDPETKALTRRRWSSKAWICCVTEFRGRRHDVWGRVYTALFFLDEVTALAAGHRPCFECRNRDAKSFAIAWANADGRDTRMRAGAMDDQLHLERQASAGAPGPELGVQDIAALPGGAMIEVDGEAYANREGDWMRWSFAGYEKAKLPRGLRARLVTPPSIVRALEAGYRPKWHASAGAL